MSSSRRGSSRSSLLRLAVLATVVSIANVPVASASTSRQHSFSGNACALVSAKQVATIVGDTSTSKYKCAASKTVKTPAGTTSAAQAGSSTPSGGGFFSIQVVKYTSPSIENRVKQQYKTLLKPVTGVGNWAYSSIKMSPVFGGTADTGQFVLGAKGYGVLINVRGKLKKTVNQPALKTLAKQIVGEL
jgi:hypothetical protein